MKRGEVWWADLAEPRGSEPGDRRPVLVVQDDSASHAGHSGATRDDGSRGETHFTVRIVSE